jgi:hypothetical protein
MLRLVSATLVALAGLIIHAQAETISISGTTSSTVTTNLTGTPPANMVGTAPLSGTGSGTLGAFSITANGTLTVFGPDYITLSVTNGTFTDTFSDGTLFGTDTATGTTNGINTNSVVSFIFTGGTGAFAGDTGTETSTESIVNATGADSASFTGTLTTTPLPAALPLFAGGLGALGLFGWRRKRKNAAALAAA